MDIRFQTLDEKIGDVQNQLFELQYGKDNWSTFTAFITISSSLYVVFIPSYTLFVKTNRGRNGSGIVII